jgi:hypothetical protein
MADACPDVSLSTLSRIATWHIRNETDAKALGENDPARRLFGR